VVRGIFTEWGGTNAKKGRLIDKKGVLTKKKPLGLPRGKLGGLFWRKIGPTEPVEPKSQTRSKRKLGKGKKNKKRPPGEKKGLATR